MVPYDESSKKFHCEKCNYNTSRKSQYDRHLLTDKHYRLQNPISKKFDTEKLYECDCGKAYKHYSTLHTHKKHCDYIGSSKINSNKIEESEIKLLTNLVLEVVKQNSELVVKNNEAQKQNQELTNKIVEICKVNTINNTLINNNSNNTNNTNNTFNLNMFLNETCKDAMNIMDFVDSLKLQLSDLEEVGKLGFVEGISNIIVKNLKALDVTERPIHCADKKREIIYVKDDNKWEKENDQKLKIRRAIKKVAYKNERLLSQFKEKHPGCNYSESQYSDQYSKLVIEALGGKDNNDFENENKIIRRIAKEVVIDKSKN
jgi:hypothetical protein